MNFIKYYVWPLVAMVSGPVAIQLLINYPRDSSMIGIYPVDEQLKGFQMDMLVGNLFSWIVTLAWIAWNILFLAIPFDHYIGRPTLFGYAPNYVHNGAPLYISNFLAFLMFHSFYPYLSFNVYMQFPYFVGTFNILGLLGTFALWVLSDPERFKLEDKEKLKPAPYLYELFRGMQLHPEYFDVDIKQLIIRFGFMTWQMFLLCFVVVSYLQHGFDPGLIANAAVQLVYLLFFFNWEKGFLIALEMTYSRVGFFFVWGFINWVPFFYSYSTYYLVNHPTKLNYVEALLFFVIGAVINKLKFNVDHEKYKFRETNGVDCRIWGKDASYVEVQYETSEGLKKSRLLTSGYWGIARHMNYTFEIVCALTWTLSTYRVNTILTFLYPIYLLVLLIHRTYRDEAKCTAKYGTYWHKYCSIVKYKMIPHLF